MLTIDSKAIAANYPNQPFLVRHALSEHALFQTDRILELARTLPPAEIEYNAGDLAVSQDPKQTPANGLSPEETIRRIRECRSWMVLKHVERDAAYRELLHSSLDVAAQAHPALRGMQQREGFVFLSSPGSVTPFHMDPEHNFLLQIRGLKTVYMWDPADREVLSEETIERFYGDGSHRNMPFDERWQAKALRFDLYPGDGVYFPPTAPHWVQNGPDVSVSFSITFRSEQADRRQRVYWVNHRLRKAGLQPSAFGQSPSRDSAKNLTIVSLGRARRALHLS
jgi:ribosomal protein L16 Arg81 hydroxylase